MEKAILFGASGLGVKALNQLKDRYEVVYFCDNDINKINQRVCGIEVIDPVRLKNIEYKYKIIITSIYYKEICIQLNNYGIKNYDIFIRTPMVNIQKKIEEKGVKFNKLKVLEVFGGNGKGHTLEYYNKVNNLEVWEINPEYEKDLKENLPKADIKITDTFEEVKITEKKYDMVVIDNSPGMFGNHCEHLDLIKFVPRIINDEAIIILNIVPERTEKTDNYKYAECFNEKHNNFRKLFYETLNPEKIDINYMVKIYEKFFLSKNFKLEWYLYEKRSFVYYLVLKLKK
ncbi:nucleoside-diphosphate sugar epimerase/dehydratase [Clostridium sp. ZS2-4]|uniref:nucleoside-diphosphate sugar epimerase/dehydratase n=1 Tax=Clostridium sp. ZS2-4 TaxID=2987703 RepID=UPI00227D58DB|nr:hypothetical protein [Clostridium sp. ZS2-4]MCY6353981.1 hypothetical protein [Clostridium sp. ZS2-4]